MYREETNYAPPAPPFWRDVLIGFVVQFIGYFNLTFNYRAVAHEKYLVIAVSDMLAVLIAYTIIRRVVKQESKWMLLGMMVGGALAGVVGTWITRSWT